jgi:hypothetical protein
MVGELTWRQKASIEEQIITKFRQDLYIVEGDRAAWEHIQKTPKFSSLAPAASEPIRKAKQQATELRGHIEAHEKRYADIKPKADAEEEAEAEAEAPEGEVDDSAGDA